MNVDFIGRYEVESIPQLIRAGKTSMIFPKMLDATKPKNRKTAEIAKKYSTAIRIKTE